MKTFREIENALRDYHWMIKEVSRLREELSMPNTKMTATYGIEASMPKAGGTSDPVGKEVMNRDRKSKTLSEFSEKVKFIEDNMSAIKSDRAVTVFNCLIDGLSFVAIAHHMGFSERKIYFIRDQIVNEMKKHANGE